MDGSATQNRLLWIPMSYSGSLLAEILMIKYWFIYLCCGDCRRPRTRATPQRRHNYVAGIWRMGREKVWDSGILTHSVKHSVSSVALFHTGFQLGHGITPAEPSHMCRSVALLR